MQRRVWTDTSIVAISQAMIMRGSSPSSAPLGPSFFYFNEQLKTVAGVCDPGN
jgi:hypothetical protein